MVNFFHLVVGVPVVSKEILRQRSADYQNWVEAFARNHRIPIEWAEKGVRKEDHVLPWQRRMVKTDTYGVYFIFKSMEQGPTFRVTVPKYPTKDPHYRILARQRSRFTHYYFYIRDETLGPIVMRVASFLPFQTTYYLNGHSFIEQELNRAQIGFRKTDNAFLAVDDVAALQAAADRLSPDIIRKRLDYCTLILGPKFSAKERKLLNLSRFYAIAQIEYCRNFIFKRHFPIHKLFERSCELGLWRLTADKIADIFGTRLNRRMRGKLATIIDRIEHGHHVFRAYFKNAFLKQYEKLTTFLRNELVSNNLADFRLKKGLDRLHTVRERFQYITARFAGFQTQLSVHRAVALSSPRPLFRLHAEGAVEADGLAVDHRIGDDVEHEASIFLGLAEALWEGHRLAEALLRGRREAHHQRRREEAGRDGVDADAHRREFARRRQRQRDDAALGGGIGGLADLPLEGRNRRCRDDDAALAFGERLELLHVGGGKPHQIEGADEIDVDDTAELVERMRPLAADDARADADPGAIDQHARRALHLARRRHRRLATPGIGDVATDGDAADLGRDLLGVLLVDVEHRHLGAGRRQGARRRRAETRSAAGDDRRVTLQLHARLLRFRPRPTLRQTAVFASQSPGSAAGRAAARRASRASRCAT